jgi:excinuclease UvrABC nuclease subunit
MELGLFWHRPITLRSGYKENLIYTVNEDKIPDVPGIYIFARKYGRAMEPLYVGRAVDLQARIIQQLNNTRLMVGIKKAAVGYRTLLLAELVTKPGQQLDKALKIVESGFIKHYLAEGYDLLNIQGTQLTRHTISSERRHFRQYIPINVYVEKQ